MLPKVSQSKKAAKESTKPTNTLNNKETLQEHVQKKLFSQFESITNVETLPMSTSVTTEVLEMPAPGSRRALDFDSQNSEDLKEFLEEFEELAEKCGLTAKEKAKIVVKYVDRETKKFWKRLEEYGDDYEILKKKISGAYSKILLEDKPTVAQLIKLVKKSAKKVIENEEDLDAYYRRFWIIVADLMEAEVINKKQHNVYFWKRLSYNLHYAIGNCLEA